MQSTGHASDESADTPPDAGVDSEGQSHEKTTGPDALNEAVRRVAEAREYLVYLAAVELDRLKLKLRRVAILAVIAVVGLIVLLATLISATALILWGVADLIGARLGGHTWAGALIMGGGILLLGALGLSLGAWVWNRSALHAARRRYEARKQRQRAQFGRSVDRQDDKPQGNSPS